MPYNTDEEIDDATRDYYDRKGREDPDKVDWGAVAWAAFVSALAMGLLLGVIWHNRGG